MNNSKNPRIRKNFSVVVHNPDLVEIKAGVWNVFSHVIEDESKGGKLFEIIKCLLDGANSPSQIAKENSIDRSVVEGVIDQLTQLGAIEYSASNAFDYYLDEMAMMLKRPETQAAEKRLKRPVLLLGAGSFMNEVLRILGSSLEDQKQIQTLDPLSLLNNHSEWTEDGLAFEKMLSLFEPWKDHFWIYIQETVNPVVSNSLNRIAFALQVSWLNVAIDGPFIFIGPLFKGGEGPCYNCFETRITMNLRERESYQKYKYALTKNQVHGGKIAEFSAVNSLAASLAAMEILNFSLTGSALTVKKALSIYIPTMEIVYNTVLQLSSCEICSTVIHREKQQLYFDIQTLLK